MDAPLSPVPNSATPVVTPAAPAVTVAPTPPAQVATVVAAPVVTAITPATPTSPPDAQGAPVVPVAPESGGSKKMLFAIIGIVLVAGLAAAAYFTMGGGASDGGSSEESAPPSLTISGGAKGSFMEEGTGLLKFESSDFAPFKAREEQFKKDNIAAIKLKSGVNYVYAEKEISFEDVVNAVDPVADRMAVTFYDAGIGKFKIYPKGPFDETQEVKAADIKTTKIPAGSGFVVLAEREANLYGTKFGADKSAVAPTLLADDKTGWQLIAVNDASLSTVLKLLIDKKRIGSVWAQSDDTKFEKVTDVGSYVLKKYLIWVNVKAPGAGGDVSGTSGGTSGTGGASAPTVTGFASDSPKSGEQGKLVVVKIAGTGLAGDSEVISGSTGVTVGVKSADADGKLLNVSLTVAKDAVLGDVTLTVTPKGGTPTPLTFAVVKAVAAALAAPTGLSLSYVDGLAVDAKSVDPTKLLKISWNGPLPSSFATQSKDESGVQGNVVSYHMKFTFGSATFDVPFNSLKTDITPSKSIYVTSNGNYNPEFVDGVVAPSGKTSVADLCFVSIYAAQTKHAGKDWICDYVYIPPSVLEASKLNGFMQYDTAYNFSVTATDDEGVHESTPASIAFTTTANLALSPTSGIQGQQGIKMTVSGNGLKDAKITTEKTQLTVADVASTDDGKKLTFTLNIADDIAAIDWTNIIVTRKDGTVLKLPFAVYKPTVYIADQKVLTQGSKDAPSAKDEFQWYVAKVIKSHDNLYDVELDNAAKEPLKNLVKGKVASYDYHPASVIPKQVLIAHYENAYWMATVQSVAADGKITVELYTPAKNKVVVTLGDVFVAGDDIKISQTAIDASNAPVKNEKPEAVTGITLKQDGVVVADMTKIDITKPLIASWNAPAKILNGGAILQSLDEPTVGATLGKQLALSYIFSLDNSDSKKIIWNVAGDLTGDVSNATEDASCKKQIWYQSLASAVSTYHGWTCASVTIPAKLLEEGVHYSFSVSAVNATTISNYASQPASLSFQTLSSNPAPVSPAAGGNNMVIFNQYTASDTKGAVVADATKIDISDATKSLKATWVPFIDTTLFQSTDEPGINDMVGKDKMLSYQVVLKNTTNNEENVLVSDNITTPVNGTEDNECVKKLWYKPKMESQTITAVSHNAWTCTYITIPNKLLAQGKKYKIRIQASDGKLMSEWMESSFITVAANKENVAPSTPQNVSFWQDGKEIKNINANSTDLVASKPLTVKWDPSSDGTMQLYNDKDAPSPLGVPVYKITPSTPSAPFVGGLIPDQMTKSLDASLDTEFNTCRVNKFLKFVSDGKPYINSYTVWNCNYISFPSGYFRTGNNGNSITIKAFDGALESAAPVTGPASDNIIFYMK